MTVASVDNSRTYNGNGATTAFSFPVYFLANEDLRVVVRSTAGTETVQTINTHYSVSGAGNINGGTVTMVTAPAVGEVLAIVREPAATQTTDYTEGDPFPANSHERGLDKLTMIAQRLKERVDRSIVLTDTAAAGSASYNIGGNRLSNVAPGTSPTDAATVSQVQAAQATANQVPTPVLADVGKVLTATGASAYLWDTPAVGGGAAGVPAGLLTNLSIGATAAAGVLTISLLTATDAVPSGASKGTIPFRSATAANGALTTLDVTTANTLTVSAGSTLGVTLANDGFALWVVAFDDGGTIRLGVVKCLSGTTIFPLHAQGLGSATAEGGAGAADSAQIFYAGAAISGKAYTVLARLEWGGGLATPGTWITPTKIETYHRGMRMPGSVTQLVHVPKSDTYAASTSGALTDIPGIAATITPTSAANLIRVIPRVQGSTDTNQFAASLSLLRGSTVIGGGTAAGNRVSAFGGYPRTTDGNSDYTATAVVFDAPGTTSAVTYRVQFILQVGTGATIYVNRTQNDTDIAGIGRYSSSITLEEIQT